MVKETYVELEYPNGSKEIVRIMTNAKTLKGIQEEFLGTKEHMETEAFPIRIVKKPMMNRVNNNNNNFDSFGLPTLPGEFF